MLRLFSHMYYKFVILILSVSIHIWFRLLKLQPLFRSLNIFIIASNLVLIVTIILIHNLAYHKCYTSTLFLFKTSAWSFNFTLDMCIINQNMLSKHIQQNDNWLGFNPVSSSLSSWSNIFDMVCRNTNLLFHIFIMQKTIITGLSEKRAS